MKKNLILIAGVIFCLAASAHVYAFPNDNGGFSLGSQRVIYTEGGKDGTITVRNGSQNTPYLIQSWVSAYNASNTPGKAIKGVVVTPPLYRLDQGENTLRIIFSSPPQNGKQEEVYWLNVKAIPAGKSSDKDASALRVAYLIRVKLFKRPQGMDTASAEAYKQLQFSLRGGQLVVRNPSPYFITFYSLMLAGRKITTEGTMVPPNSMMEYPLPAGWGSGHRVQVSWSAINDFGAKSETQSAMIN
ncbi:fimbrial biogenesis chaperone [Serratia bockelmannii]|uniref:fimbrial biogenesis chaperone n=1 Tax=Serratia bockelmannii TaxID=2703793 RepID=UPI003FA7D697